MLFGTTRDHSLLTGFAQDDTSLQREDKQQREGRTFVCVNTLTLPLFLLKKIIIIQVITLFSLLKI